MVFIKQRLAEYLKTSKTISNILGDFEIGAQLGEGATSTVRLAKIGNVEFAIKFLAENIYENETTAYKRFKQAYLNLIRLQNSGCILNHIHFDAVRISDDCLIPYSIMEKADKTLSSHKKKKEIDFEAFEKIFLSLGKSIQLLHDNGIIHRDLKPENIFIKQDGQLAIGDFDIAKFVDDNHIKLVKTKESDRLANFHFSAPEQSSKKNSELTTAADWFAFGQILHWLITGETLRGQSGVGISQKDDRYIKYFGLIKNLLQQEPSSRPQSFEDIKTYIDNYHSTDDGYYRYIEKQFEALHLFDKIVYKYTPKFGINGDGFRCFDDSEDIKDIMNDLSEEVNKLYLWWTQEYKSTKVELIKYNKDSKTWFLDNDEIAIRSIWFYKASESWGKSCIVIETKKLKPIFKENEGFGCESFAVFDGHIISIDEYEVGWAEVGGKRMKLNGRVEPIRRNLEPQLFFIAPAKSAVIADKNLEIQTKISRLFIKAYINTALANSTLLTEDMLQELRYIDRDDDVAMWR